MQAGHLMYQHSVSVQAGVLGGIRLAARPEEDFLARLRVHPQPSPSVRCVSRSDGRCSLRHEPRQVSHTCLRQIVQPPILCLSTTKLSCCEQSHPFSRLSILPAQHITNISTTHLTHPSINRLRKQHHHHSPQPNRSPSMPNGPRIRYTLLLLRSRLIAAFEHIPPRGVPPLEAADRPTPRFAFVDWDAPRARRASLPPSPRTRRPRRSEPRARCHGRRSRCDGEGRRAPG